MESLEFGSIRLKRICKTQRCGRLSNMELLRIISMFGVLVVHADFGALGYPSYVEITTMPIFAFCRTMIEAFAIVAVNVFVMLSGWFGITFRWEGLCKLIFQCLFFTFGIYITCIGLGVEVFSIEGIRKCLMLTGNVWFIKCYLGLYILAPAMNIYVEKVKRKTVRNTLLCFFAFQSLYDWIAHSTTFIQGGYSAFSFIGLYLLARYVHVYRPAWSQYSKSRDFLIYCVLSLFTCVFFLLFAFWDKPIAILRFMDYSSPFIIVAALFILLLFSKFSFQSKLINFIAVSCLAVYLQHFIIFPKFMNVWIKNITNETEGIWMMICITGLLIAFFVTAILIDKIRLLLWNRLFAPMFK